MFFINGAIGVVKSIKLFFYNTRNNEERVFDSIIIIMSLISYSSDELIAFRDIFLRLFVNSKSSIILFPY